MTVKYFCTTLVEDVSFILTVYAMPCAVAKIFLNNGGQISKAGELHNYPVITASSPSSSSKTIALSKD